MSERERVVRELHDAMGDCDLCGPEQDYKGCDVRCQLERAYDAGRASMCSEVVAWLRKQHQLVAADPVDDAAKKTGLLYWRQIADAIESGSTSPEGISPERASGEPKERP